MRRPVQGLDRLRDLADLVVQEQRAGTGRREFRSGWVSDGSSDLRKGHHVAVVIGEPSTVGSLRTEAGRISALKVVGVRNVVDDGGTLAVFDYRYVPRGGPLGRLTGPLIDKMLTATFIDMLAATEEAARGDGGER